MQRLCLYPARQGFQAWEATGEAEYLEALESGIGALRETVDDDLDWGAVNLHVADMLSHDAKYEETILKAIGHMFEDYSRNDIAINWQAGLVYLLAAGLS